MEKKRYLDINRERLAAINAPYDPMTGLGSVSTPRKKIQIEDFPSETMWLPSDFAETPFVKALSQMGAKAFITSTTNSAPTERAITDLFMAFCQERTKYDFEFWAASCCTITRKGDNADIMFTLNRAQRKYLTYLEQLRLAGKPIDIILVKARQWGGSTLTILYALWIMLVIKVNWNAVICGEIENQSHIVIGMLQKVLDRYPFWASGGIRIKTTPYQGAQSTRVISSSGSRFSVGSAQKPDKIRSENISIAHLTEVGLWKATKGKKPEDIIQAIFGSIAPLPYTMKIIESTAKGVGNYLHKTWIDAVAGHNNFTPVFIAWFDIDLYSKNLSPEEEEHIVDTMTPYERHLFNIGASLQAIAWYRIKEREFFGNKWRMCQEYPSDASEAFQTSGARVFTQDIVDNARATCCPPAFVGDFVALENKGKGAMENIIFKDIPEEQRKGCDNHLKVWLMPDPHNNYRDRYIVSVDTSAGTSDAADFTSIIVFDRMAMIEDGVPEVCATWHGRLDPDKIPWLALTIAEAYSHALLVIESNRMESSNSAYIFEEIADIYDNLYSRSDPEKIKEGAPVKYGFHTNSATKPEIITHLNAALRDCLYIERDTETCNELEQYEYKDLVKKEMGAVDGSHDDRVMATAIGLRVAYKTPLPRQVDNTDMRRLNAHRRIVSEATL